MHELIYSPKGCDNNMSVMASKQCLEYTVSVSCGYFVHWVNTGTLTREQSKLATIS